MARKQITVWGYQCDRCGYEWIPRRLVAPKICPACKSPYYDQPRLYTVSPSRPAAKDRRRAAGPEESEG